MSGSIKSNENVFNLEFFKQIRLYHMVDPCNRKIFDVNVYQLIFIVINFINLCLVVYGISGYFFNKTENTIDEISEFLLLFSNMFYSLILLKTITFMYRANDIWELFNVLRVNFLTNRHCFRYTDIHQQIEKISTKMTYLLIAIALIVYLFWSLSPLVYYSMSIGVVHADGLTSQRIDNILNYPFPVTITTYNRYFIIFYIIEFSIITLCIFMHIVFDVFIVSFSFAIVVQYEIIARSLENIGFDDHDNNSVRDNDGKCSVRNYCDDYKSILMDQQKLYLKLKSFYSIIRIIIHLSIAVLSSEIIILSYTFVVLFLSDKSFALSKIFKIITAFPSLTIELSIICYLLEIINNKKESVSFGMYSSNWTNMSLKTKKLLLLAVRMDNANKLMMKITPKKIVNIQLFANVMMTSYNIVSVMLKSRYT